ncbi:hypothetical protein N9C66_02760 [Akkermansiaceae bacterium]|nr:hypothetical protein [Akkermansiaceae bacterium]
MLRKLKSRIRETWQCVNCHCTIGGINEPIDANLEHGEPIPYDFFIGSIHGLLFHKAGGATTRISKHSTYGITHKEDRWYVFEKIKTRLKPTGRIISFRWEDDNMKEKKVEIPLLDPEIHQIDWIDDELFITDTRNNRLATYIRNGSKLTLSREAWPFGRLKNGAQSDNYVHLNSIHRGSDNKIRLLLHNQTIKTKKKSELAILTEELECNERISLDANSGHNIIFTKETELTCDSFGSRLIRNRSVFITLDRYLRGLALNDSSLLIGGSQVAIGLKRGSPNSVGKIFHLNLFNQGSQSLLSELHLKGYGNIYEVRIISNRDLSMSNFTKGSKNEKTA